MGSGTTSVIQVTNLSPIVTNEQIRTLFTHLGTIREFVVYPSNDPSQQTARVCYIRYIDPMCASVAQHLTNTVFIDRAILVKPFIDGKIPDELLALKLANEGHSQNSSNSGVCSQIETVNGIQAITTIDPRLNALGLPQYPPLSPSLDPTKIEEIRRTVTVSNVNKQTRPEDLVELFNQFGEVKYLRMTSDENDVIKAAMIEFTDQSSVANALQNTGITFQGSQITISHATTGILKPQYKITAPPEKNSRELKRRSRSRSLRRSRSPSKSHSSRRRSRSPRRERRRSYSGSRSPSRRRRSRSRDRKRSPYRHRSRSHSKDRRSRRDRSKERERYRRRSRDRSIDRDRDYDRDRDRDRDREKSRSKKRRDHSREKDYERSRDRSKERYRKRSRSRDSDRKEKHRSKHHRESDRRRRSRSRSDSKIKLTKSPKRSSSKKNKDIIVEVDETLSVEQSSSEHTTLLPMEPNFLKMETNETSSSSSPQTNVQRPTSTDEDSVDNSLSLKRDRMPMTPPLLRKQEVKLDKLKSKNIGYDNEDDDGRELQKHHYHHSSSSSPDSSVKEYDEKIYKRPVADYDDSDD
ncbi:enoyl-CoA hydratase [Sarcoptes scabiei]|nr:enoyl-CoA hydratase [Sarcoptes scabiei]